jgi:hypothetical protein
MLKTSTLLDRPYRYLTKPRSPTKTYFPILARSALRPSRLRSLLFKYRKLKKHSHFACKPLGRFIRYHLRLNFAYFLAGLICSDGHFIDKNGTVQITFSKNERSVAMAILHKINYGFISDKKNKL